MSNDTERERGLSLACGVQVQRVGTLGGEWCGGDGVEGGHVGGVQVGGGGGWERERAAERGRGGGVIVGGGDVRRWGCVGRELWEHVDERRGHHEREWWRIRNEQVRRGSGVEV